MSNRVECVECSEQMPHHKTNSGCCPSCGGECLELDQIYDDEQDVGDKEEK